MDEDDALALALALALATALLQSCNLFQFSL